VSTRQQDSGPANPAKRISIRPTPTTSGAGEDADTTRTTPPRFVPTRPTTTVAQVVTRVPDEATDPISRFRRWFENTVAEVRKVSWPTRQEAINLTIVVIGLSAFVGVTLGLLDAIMGEVVKFLTTGVV